MSESRIVQYTLAEIEDMIARGESQTDWARAAAMTEEELEASIAADPDEAGMVFDWASATITPPRPNA